MSFSYKDDKILAIVMTMVNSGDTYNINGVDLTPAVFMYRGSSGVYLALEAHQYTISIVADDTFLIIDDETVLEDATYFQICVLQEIGSSEYNPVGLGDVDTLTALYNEAITDLHNLWNYVQNNVLLADDPNMSAVIPKLADNEMLYWDDDEKLFKGVSMSELGGTGSVTTYTHNQVTALSTWVIPHNLGRFPSVMIVDTAGSVVIGDIVYNSNTQITITFSSAFSGKAYLN